MDKLKDFVPLLQTLSWIVLILIFAVRYKKEIRSILATTMTRLEKGSEFKLGPVEIGKLQSDVREVQDKVSELNDLVSKQFMAAMGPDMYKTLEMIASGHFGVFEFGEWSGLERELYFLRDIGYIQIASIREIKKIGKGDNLSDFVKITETGTNFVELRKKILSGH